MQYKLPRFIARLRRQQPALILLPALILGQILSTISGWQYILVLILMCIVFIYKSSSYLGLACGLALGLISNIQINTNQNNLVFSDQIVLGQLSGDSIRRPVNGLISFKLKVSDVKDLNQKHLLIDRVLLCKAVNLPWKNSSALNPNDLIIFKASYRIFPEQLWPWEYQASFKRRAIDGVCKIKYLLIHKNQQTGKSNLKNNLQLRFKDIVGNDEIAGLMLSLSLGFRDQISASSDLIFKQLGIAHVLVLSGMQIGLLYYSGFKILSLLLRLVLSNPQQISLFASLLGAFISLFIVALTDFEASAMRAWIACVLISVANYQEKRVEIFKASLASLLIICLLWPGSWAEAGVQLSFAAIFGIAFGQVLARDRFENILFPTILASILSASVAALWFKQISLITIVSNFILAPLFGLLGCYLGLFSILMSFLPDSVALYSTSLMKFIVHSIFDLCLDLNAILPAFVFIEDSNFHAIAGFILILLFLCVHKTIRIWLIEYNVFSRR